MGKDGKKDAECSDSDKFGCIQKGTKYIKAMCKKNAQVRGN